MSSNNSAATIVADLAAVDAVPTGSVDCFVLETLHYVYDVRSAVEHVHRRSDWGTVL